MFFILFLLVVQQERHKGMHNLEENLIVMNIEYGKRFNIQVKVVLMEKYAPTVEHWDTQWIHAIISLVFNLVLYTRVVIRTKQLQGSL